MVTLSRIQKIALAAGAIVVVLGLGFVWGASGRFSIENALDETRQRLDLAEARGSLLEARVSLYHVNFGDASRHFEETVGPLRRARERYQQTGRNAAAGSIAAAIEHAQEGRRLAAALDQTADARAVDALQAIRVATTQ